MFLRDIGLSEAQSVVKLLGFIIADIAGYSVDFTRMKPRSFSAKYKL